MQLCGPCLVDHGQLNAFSASFTVPRVSRLAALVDTYIVNLLFLLNSHFPRAAGGLLTPLPLRKRSDFKQALSTLERLHTRSWRRTIRAH